MTSTNRHRTRLGEEQLRVVLARAGINPAHLVRWSELGQATYNTAYRIRLTGGEGLVLKIAPDPAAPTLTYERGIMRTEAEFYRAAAGVVPVPEVVHADFSRELFGTDLLLMTELPGTSWRERAADLDTATGTRLRTALGTVVAALHGITGTGFGYPQRTATPTWRAAFTMMVGDLLPDAARYSTPLPRPLERIGESVGARADVLDRVTTPALVHFDLWQGNILLHGGRISGLVDGERALWGDPLAEFTSLALFGAIEDDPAFLSGYGEVVFDAAARTRLALYRTYLYLVMLVESGPRGYSGPDHDARARSVTTRLTAALDELDR